MIHCNGKLIPHEFPVTDLQQITDADGKGRIICTVSSGTARFSSSERPLQTGGVTQIENKAEAILRVNLTASLQNRDVYCTDSQNNIFYLFTSRTSEFKALYVCVHMCTYSICMYSASRKSSFLQYLKNGNACFCRIAKKWWPLCECRIPST